MDKDKRGVHVHREYRRRTCCAALLLIATSAAGFLSGSVVAQTKRDAPLVASTKLLEVSLMKGSKSSPVHSSVQTASGRISYTEQGTGPVALFVHGVLLNGYLWRHQLADLSDIRRCIAVDLLAHG